MNKVKLFLWAQAFTDKVPETLSRTVFELIGTAAGLSNLRGVRRLRKNCRRIAPLSSGPGQRLRSARIMRSYLRYYHGSLRLPALTAGQIRARVRVDNLSVLRARLRSGSAAAALLHCGNWDLAGAWANMELAPVHTIAEKLSPPELADYFLDFRRKLGMTIYQAVKGGNSIGKLTADMRGGKCLVPLLCDRDLSATGVEVSLCGKTIRVAPGAAILAVRLGVPLIPVFIREENFSSDRDRVRRAGSPWGIRITVGEPIPVPPKYRGKEKPSAEILRDLCQKWMNQAEKFLTEYPEQWYMLQKVFTEDLDPARLAAAGAPACGKDSFRRESVR
ncbi:phosphatidylinositol mannoside acyltransferase [Arcanobacterium sp. S3PF19]|uniref:phosphatidylinositol mannoside acyltransferase n=1 Tax=Arcanobacterium sp. S3PF19 TaxID=1219585 RepID=UPI000691E49F|nr:phosphatidylinositol mannoside acyltransferase [Arcanobacterium sp. S3PF19]